MVENFLQRGYELTDQRYVEANRAGEIHPDQEALLGRPAGRLVRWAAASTHSRAKLLLLVPFLLIFALLALWSSEVLSCTIAAAGGALVIAGTLGLGLYRLYRLRGRSTTLRENLEKQAIRSTTGRVVFEKEGYRIEAGDLELRLPFGGFTTLSPGTDYRFYYLAEAGDVLSAESLGRARGQRARETLTEILAKANGFQVQALPSNRSGSLAPSQFKHLLRDLILPLAFGVVILGVAVRLIQPYLTAESPPDIELGRILIAGLVVVAGIVSLYLSARSLLDILGGRVETLTGRIRLEQRTSRDDEGATTKYFYKLGTQRFSVNKRGFRALVPTATYRVYFTPHSKTLVNIETLEAPTDQI